MYKLILNVEVVPPNVLHLTQEELLKEIIEAEMRMNSDGRLRFHIIKLDIKQVSKWIAK